MLMLKEEEDLIKKLIRLDKKKIINSDVKTAGKELGFSAAKSLRIYENFSKFGKTNLKFSQNGDKASTEAIKKIKRQYASRYYSGLKSKKFSDAKARKIIRRYIFEQTPTVCLLREYGITSNGFYNLIQELNVTGYVGKTKILNPAKYKKLNLKDVIRWNKGYPSAIKELSNDELLKLQYIRYLQVLDKYL